MVLRNFSNLACSLQKKVIVLSKPQYHPVSGETLHKTKKAFYSSGLAKGQKNSSQAIWSLAMWKNTKEGDVGVGKAKFPLGDTVCEGSREELSYVSGQSLLQLLDKNDRSIFPSSAFLKNKANTINAQQYSSSHVRDNHLLIIFWKASYMLLI